MIISKLVLGIGVNISRQEGVLSLLEKRIRSSQKTLVVSLNPEMAVLACKEPEFKAIIDRADLVIPDGAGIVWALRRQGVKLERLTGTDLVLALIKLKHKTLLVGGREGVAEAAAKKLGVLALGEPNVAKINKIKPDLLFVALGHGKQERWLAENLPRLNVKLAMGVGGALDQIAKPWLRAPKFLQNLGLEWLYRLILQPWRLKRQLALIKFIWYARAE